MSIAVEGDHLVAGAHRCPIRRVPTLVDLHLLRVPGTQDLEALGLELRTTCFPVQRLPAFIRKVCTWGGYAGIAGRVINNNSLDAIRSAFLRVSAAFEAGSNPADGNVEALWAVNQLHSLGTPSFATKHLRFLFPRSCPVLDSRVSVNFDYSMNSDGYRRYSADCIRVARELTELGVMNPMRRLDGHWFAADVDMAVFAMIAPWSEE